ncbi:MAG: deoxyribodipyrimidine photolyase [Deltaproteobacteria bacterium]|nr:deoxyribodipyrimidine photolyase [Deltaproteobacteria bacterium]
MSQRTVPKDRIRKINQRPINPDGEYVLYWMIAARRTGWNFALQHAINHAAKLGKPLIVLEALRCDYPYASDRFHRFIIDGMLANANAFQNHQVLYYPYVSRRPGDDKGFLAALSVQACLVITDDCPAFIMPKLVEAAGAHLPMLLEAIDGNGLLPLKLADRAYPTAYAFRRFLQKTLPSHFLTAPCADPFHGIDLPRLNQLPSTVTDRWPMADLTELSKQAALAKLPIDHSVPVVAKTGGEQAAKSLLELFLKAKLGRYAEERNHPDIQVTSELSACLHFGHISSHAIFAAITAQEDWSPQRLGPKADGKRSGWWGLSINAEAFLDQLITWRELGYNMCTFEPAYRDYASLPDWARKTLDDHSLDPRPYCYSLKELREARTHDPLWNAAQRQLLTDGMIHNYLRMLWGKKILEWSPTPQQALEAMIELNDRFAIDGRDPNSYSGIFWCLGRYDRPWGPKRPIFGSVRYMSSENTQRKVKLSNYLKRYGQDNL